ncbi:protein-L-isoaspartate O-methyltransferase family protein [Kitasatospora purpeofusca]|uniref:protein-L-isoaspartate O-methyltransferase family protein n=1 Tax=Kitasatospora purpeofusca TaxID=67352 RepID=UPI002A5A65DA|nr:methyltransferase domain-containing protein [Kitasatospora purpeofusca]MDY0812074.1 methyltransferase domain-containing protein [Kitasatospora purpeofusca]
MSRDLTDRRTRLDAVMEQRNAWPKDSPWLREAMAALPRDAFAPDRLWRWDGRAYAPIDRPTSPAAWADELYAGPDAAAVTQVTGGLPSSSLSAPAVVADMLDSLLLEPGHTVWDIGTGQGWSCALAARRAGPGLVVSTEIDEDLALLARARIAAAGVDAEVVVGNATSSMAPGGPFDRIHATYAVETVPRTWIEATKPGGRIVYPWGRLGHVALTVAADGRGASGRVQGLGQFMADRSGPVPPVAGHDGYAKVRGTADPAAERIVVGDFAPLADDWDLRFAVRVAVPDAVVITGRDEDGVNAWIHDGHASWAALSARGDNSAVLHQGGPRRIGDELLTARSRWEARGRPTPYDFGITVTPERQWVWLRDPDGVRRPV